MSAAAIASRVARPVRTHLDWLESEAIHILREVAGQCQNPALLFSGGKDSPGLLRLGPGPLRSESDSRNAAQSVTLLEAIAELSFDAAIGGARRDEEKARAKERVFSFRGEFGQWDPPAQRPRPV